MTPSEQIDARISELGDWRGETEELPTVFSVELFALSAHNCRQNLFERTVRACTSER